MLERHRLLSIEPEVQPQNLRLALLQVRERFLDGFRERFLERLLVRRWIEVVREIVEELVVFAGGHRCIEGEMSLRDRHRLRDFFLRDVHAVGDLFVRRLATELLEERVCALANAMQRAGAVERHTNDP